MRMTGASRALDSQRALGEHSSTMYTTIQLSSTASGMNRFVFQHLFSVAVEWGPLLAVPNPSILLFLHSSSVPH